MSMRVTPYTRGTVITEPGIYAGVPIDLYHSQALCDGPSVSSSGLRKIFSESPAHFFATWDGNPEREEQPVSEALTLGRAAHHLLLGEDDFSTLFVQRPETIGGAAWQGNRTACKAWLAEQAAKGRTVLKPEQVKTIRGMARALAAHPLVQAGALNGRVEMTMVWRCKDTGIWVKARPDVIPNDSGDFVDLKTTVSVQFDDIQRTIADYGYQMQAALVHEGWLTLTGMKPESFTLAFVEKAPPYCVRFATLWHEDLVRGDQQNLMSRATFKRCLDANEWPGPGGDDAEHIALPEWMQKRIDTRLERATAEAA